MAADQLDLFSSAPGAASASLNALVEATSLRMAGTYGASAVAGSTCGNCKHKRESARVQQRVFYRCGIATPNYEPGRDVGRTWSACEFWEGRV